AINKDGNKQKYGANHQVRAPYHVGFQDAVIEQLLTSRGGEFGGRVLDAGKDESSAKEDDHHRPDRIEELCEIEPPRGRFLPAQHGDIGVGRDFQKRAAAGHHENGEQEECVHPNRSCGNKQKGARSVQEQSSQNSYSPNAASASPPAARRESNRQNRPTAQAKI